jgi:phospholipid transport system substrate-binding protein
MKLGDFSRRDFIAGFGALGAAISVPSIGAAQSLQAATDLVQRAVDAIISTISSGRSESAMIREFERILDRHADVAIIARSVLGPTARTISRAQLNAFTDAFSGYMARKYGRRFREFIGGQITITGARPVRNFYEVITTVNMPSGSSFELSFLVSNASGQYRIFNLVLEGVNMMISERNEIGALLDRNGGNVDALTAELRRL